MVTWSSYYHCYSLCPLFFFFSFFPVLFMLIFVIIIVRNYINKSKQPKDIQHIYQTYTNIYPRTHMFIYVWYIYDMFVYFLVICYAYVLEESGLNFTINRPKACSTNPSFSWTINKSKYTWLGLHIYIRACVSVYIWVRSLPH